MNKINKIQDIDVFNLKNIICCNERRNQKILIQKVNEIPNLEFNISYVLKIEI